MGLKIRRVPEGWVDSVSAGRMLGRGRETILMYSKFAVFMFPRAIFKKHQYLWKKIDLLRWKVWHAERFRRPWKRLKVEGL